MKFPPTKQQPSLGLRETVLQADTRDEVEDCIAAADRCTHMSRKTRNGIRNAAAKRRKEWAK